jgi:hypothetical protein
VGSRRCRQGHDDLVVSHPVRIRIRVRKAHRNVDVEDKVQSRLRTRCGGASAAVREWGSKFGGDGRFFCEETVRARLWTPHSKNPCRIACRCISCVLLSSDGGLDEVCRWLSARGGTTIPVRAGAGRSGRPASELTSGEDRGGEGDGEDVCTEIDADMAGGGVDAGCC